VRESRRHLLDASALLAVILGEPGTDRVEAVLDDSEMAAVNVAEVARKLFAKGMTQDEIAEILIGLNLETGQEQFSYFQAICAGALAAANRHIGLSLGDAVCLTVGAWSGKKVVTAERSWAQCEWPELVGFTNAPEVLTIR
jgi:PIN domain nuclease of toxin-antitoxin system